MVGKRIATLLVIVICGVVLLLSYLQWKDKLSEVGGSASGLFTERLSEIASADDGAAEFTEAETVISEDSPLTRETIRQLTANMPADIPALMNNRFDKDEPIRLLIAGSQAISQGGEGGAARLIADFLDAAYEGFIETDILALSGTSKDFLEAMEDTVDWDSGYDLLLFEPFTLNNNGKVIIEDEHRHILTVRDKLHSYKEDAELIIMPSQPIYRPNFYGTQIRSLGKFTETQGIPYINHWDEWPDSTSENISAYLEEDSAPNDMGANAWASAVQRFFGADF